MQSLSKPMANAILNAIIQEHPEFKELATTALATPYSGNSNNVAMASIYKFFKQCLEATNNPDLGLLAYKTAHPANLGMLGYAVMSCIDLESALRRIVENQSMLSTGFSLSIEESETQIKIIGVPLDPSENMIPRALIDSIASITLALFQWLVPKCDVFPDELEVSYPMPDDCSQLISLFGTNLVFSSTINALTFKKSDAALRIASHNSALDSLHEEQLKLSRMEQERKTILPSIQREITKTLGEFKTPNMTEISQSIGMSNHQLRRALVEQGTTFQDLVDRARMKKSAFLIAHTSQSLKSIAIQIGLKNQSALNKACERWFGMTPSAYRVTNSPLPD
ncbi:AraC family transcriptional regulator ligand-binding domain-containing protein [Pseudomonas monteilii]|uniref:AraC family transcriptional regulator n=1 Tax=Pseudomonas monteilii TaxID=76759 RepID=UPI0038118031